MFSTGCVMADCIDPAGVSTGDYYSFSITNSTLISNASISFWEFNNDCHAGCASAQAFSVQYDTDPAFGNPKTVQSFVPQTPGSANYTFPINGTLAAGTYYFRILATGVDNDVAAQYVFDNVTLTGSH